MGKLEANRPFARSRPRYEDNIKMGIREMVGQYGLVWSGPAVTSLGLP